MCGCARSIAGVSVDAAGSIATAGKNPGRGSHDFRRPFFYELTPDFNPTIGRYSTPPGSSRASSRDVWMTEPREGDGAGEQAPFPSGRYPATGTVARRLREGLVTPLPGGHGKPIGGHYAPSARSFAGLGLARLPRPWKRGPEACVSSFGRGCEPRWSAERRPRSREGTRLLKDWCATRCSIPSIFPRGKEEGRQRTRRCQKHGRFRLPA